MRILRIVLPALSLFLAACSVHDVCGGLYEGARVKNQLNAPPSEQWGKSEPSADYRQYEQRRQEMLKRDGQASP